jgi:hypothetical protein
LEVKKLHNGSFWNGLNKQLVEDMEADETKNGWLMAVQLRPKGVSEKRLEPLPEAVEKLSKEKGPQYSLRRD